MQRPLDVVLARHGRAEEPEQRIADVLLDPSAVLAHHAGQLAEGAQHQVADLFRNSSRSERGVKPTTSAKSTVTSRRSSGSTPMPPAVAAPTGTAAAAPEAAGRPPCRTRCSSGRWATSPRHRPRRAARTARRTAGSRARTAGSAPGRQRRSFGLGVAVDRDSPRAAQEEGEQAPPGRRPQIPSRPGRPIRSSVHAPDGHGHVAAERERRRASQPAEHDQCAAA